MKPELQYSILCDDVRQEKNGKFIFIGAFNLITVQKFPVVYPFFHVSNQWCSGQGEFKEQSKIVNEENKLLAASPEIAFTLKDFTSSHIVISRFGGIKFDAPGKYAIEIMLDGELFRRFAFSALQTNKEPAL